MEPTNPLLDQFILNQAGKPRPKICYLPTASGDQLPNIDNWYSIWKKRDCEPSHLSLFKGHTADHRGFLLSQDIVYVGGGNTRNMMVLWREWGIDLILREAYEAGVVMAGVSAGSLCWFEEGVTDSIPGRLSVVKCLGWLKGSNCPHYDGETERRPSYHRLMAASEIGEGIACDDSVAAHFVNEKFVGCVSSVEGKHGYFVRMKGGVTVEEKITPRFLGAK